MSAARIPVIGIIGGIGSGKTAVAEALGKLISVRRLDADVAGHRVLLDEKVKDALRKTFGDSIFDEQGEIVRSDLAKLVFGNQGTQQVARAKLEKIVHPEIRKILENQLEEIQYQQDCDVIILDAALMLEAGWSEVCDAIVYLDVPEAVRLQRVQQRGWSEQEFRKREASQLSLSEKQNRAEITISNATDLQSTANQLANWIKQNHSYEAMHH